MTAQSIGGLYASLGLNTAEFTAGLSQARSSLAGFGTAIKSFAAAAGLATVGQLGISALKQAAQIGDLAETIGVTAEQIQVYNRMAVASGTSADVMARGLQEIASQAVDADSALSRLFAANGLEAKTMGVNEQIRTFMELLRNARTQSEQLAIAEEVLGKRIGRELVEAMREGAAGYDQMQRDMIESGELMSDAEITRLQELETEYNLVTDRIGAYWMKMVVGLVESTETFGSKLSAFREEVQRKLWGTTDAEIAAANNRNPGPYPEGNTPAPGRVTVMGEKTDKGSGGRGGGRGRTEERWRNPGYTSENPMQEGPITIEDIRGPALELSNLSDQFDEAQDAAGALADTITNNLGSALSGIASGTMSVKDAFGSMAQSLIADLGDIAAELLKSGLLKLLGQFGPSAFGGGGLFGSSFGGFYAEGGHLGAGQWGFAGERGIEMVKGPATIEPMTAGGGIGQVIVNNYSGSEVRQQERRGPDGSRTLELLVGDIAERRTAKSSKKMLGSGYGISPQLLQR